VILVHRLLKNAVSEKVGGRAYALYSDACIQTMGIDPAAQGFVEHQETIDTRAAPSSCRRFSRPSETGGVASTNDRSNVVMT
jgi:hypothetical protein